MAIILEQDPVLTSAKSKIYNIFAIVSKQTKGGENGWSRLSWSPTSHFAHVRSLDLDDQAVVPIWPPRPEQLLVDEPEWELKSISAESILMVTDRVLKVWGIRLLRASWLI